MSRFRVLLRGSLLVPKSSFISRHRPFLRELSRNSVVGLGTDKEEIMIGRIMRKVSTVMMPSPSPEPAPEDTSNLENYEVWKQFQYLFCILNL